MYSYVLCSCMYLCYVHMYASLLCSSVCVATSVLLCSCVLACVWCVLVCPCVCALYSHICVCVVCVMHLCVYYTFVSGCVHAHCVWVCMYMCARVCACSHNSFRRHLPRQMQVSSVDFSPGTEPVLQRGETTTSIGRIKPELYKQKSVDSEGHGLGDKEVCGKLNFALQYDYENELLVVRMIQALDLPAKDFTGTSDPYVKVYLLPDRKKKFQTRVHRKTLNPQFDETFQFSVAYDQLSQRKLHFSIYDFDRLSRHDMIGEVVLENLFEVSDLSREAMVWKDIHGATTVRRGSLEK